MTGTYGDIPYYVPQFIWKFWLSSTGPNDLASDSRLHIYDVYENQLNETQVPSTSTRPIFRDFETSPSTRLLVQTAEQAFSALEAEAEETLNEIIPRTYLTQSTPFKFDRYRLANLRRYFAFLRFRNSFKYREILLGLEEPAAEGRVLPVYLPAFVEHHRRFVLRGIVAFLQNTPQVDSTPDPRDRPWPHLKVALLDSFRAAMNAYCWRLCDAEICLGVATDEQKYIRSDSCFGSVDEGPEEQSPYSDAFFPISPTIAVYIIGNPPEVSPTSPNGLSSIIEIGIEGAVDVHLRNSAILHTHPRHLYFSSLQSMALSVSSYDGLYHGDQGIKDYSRLKQRCRQKFLEKTVTKTLVLKSTVILTDLTDEIVQVGSCAVGYGAFSDVWKALWNDPVEKRPRTVALKVLRQIMIQNVKERLMKRLQAEVVAWYNLCHRNVSQLYGIVQFQNSIGMVSPWCENGTICEFLKGNTTANRLSLMIGIASGVAYLHSVTPLVIHGDLKGGNILIDEHGCPIITDFGLSKVIEDISDSINMKSSFFAGSTRWMAPELILALIEDDGRMPPITTHSDVYAFASVCLEVATGELPYPARSNDHAVTVDILRGVKPSRGAHCHIPFKDEEAFWHILDRCWSEGPFLRPNMTDLVGLLETLTLRS